MGGQENWRIYSGTIYIIQEENGGKDISSKLPREKKAKVLRILISILILANVLV